MGVGGDGGALRRRRARAFAPKDADAPGRGLSDASGGLAESRAGVGGS